MLVGLGVPLCVTAPHELALASTALPTAAYAHTFNQMDQARNAV